MAQYSRLDTRRTDTQQIRWIGMECKYRILFRGKFY
jgi:hypothetical protein